MISTTSKILKITYYLLFVVLVVFVLVSVGSYLSVYLTFGKVPSSNDYTQELIDGTGKSFNVVPFQSGWYVIIIYWWSVIVVTGLIPTVLLLKYFMRQLNIHPRLFLTLVISHIGLILLHYVEVFSWYTVYILD